LDFLQNIARYVYSTGNRLDVHHQIDLNGPTALGEDTEIRAIALVMDPQLGESTIVHEVHGSLFEVVTRRGRFVRLLSRRDLSRMADCLDQGRRGLLVLPRILLAIRPLAGLGLRGLHLPHIVLFNDAMAEPAWTKACEAMQHCDCMIQVGTSGTVMPAAMLPREAKAAGAKVITIDPNGGEGDICLRGTAATVLPELVRTAFGESRAA